MIDHQVNNCHSCQVGYNLFEQLEPFALTPYSNELTPVALPPGCARLSTKPPPTASKLRPTVQP